MRLLITVPWGERLGGAEAMLQMVLDGSREGRHEVALVFLEPGPWAWESIDAGFRVEIISVGRMRQAHRGLGAVVRLASVMRERRPDLILNWMGKAHLYGAPAALRALRSFLCTHGG